MSTNKVVLSNSNGFVVETIPFGATITSIKLPNGQQVALGFRNLEDYKVNPPYFGCSVGRCANRIGNASFVLNGQRVGVSPNIDPHHLHGGRRGFNKYEWSVVTRSDTSVTYKHVSVDGDEGYPGTLTVHATYTVTDKNQVIIEYTATTEDRPTIVNLTNHTYFNLSGSDKLILDHVVQLDADHYTVVDNNSIPTGEIASVQGTVMDFLTPHRIGERYQQVPGSSVGYDHNYCLNSKQRFTEDPSLCRVGSITDPSTGNSVTVYTNQPCVQLYMGGYLSDVDESMVGLEGQRYRNYHGLCLETQLHPDAINKPYLCSPILNPGGKYYSKTVWEFANKN